MARCPRPTTCSHYHRGVADLDLDVPTGRVVADRYRLIGSIGRGGSAQVYAASDTRLGRSVAVKLLHQQLVSDDRFVERFRHEAQLAAQLSHPNLLAVYDWGDDDGVYIVTELLEGGSLADLIAAGHRLSPSQALGVGLEAARGLAYAHGNGLVHRDIKPANLLFGSGGNGTTLPTHRLRVGDFGIARAVAEAAWTEPEGALIGTARYAAPEQAVGGVTGAADVYSLSLSLIEAVTGTVPLVAAGPLSTMARRQRESVEVPAELGPLVDVLSDAGRADPGTRPSAAEFATVLTELARTLPRPDPLPIVDQSPAEALPDPHPTTVLDVTQHEPTIEPGEPVDRPSALAADAPSADGADGADDGSAGDDGVVAEPAATDAPAAGPDSGTADDDLDDGDPDAPRRGRVIAAAGVAVAMAVLAAVVVTSYQRSPQLVAETTVGNAVGTNVGADGNALNAFLVESISIRQDGTTAGDVVAQLPPSWWTADAATVALVWVSDGPATGEVPELVSLSEIDAADRISEAGLEVGEVTTVYDETAPKGVVIAASPETGSVVAAESAVDLVVSNGPAPREVPALLGLSAEDAADALEPLGLSVGNVAEDFSDTVAAGLVLRADPGAGEMVARGESVDLVISKGPQFFEVPDVEGEDADDATDDLEDAGFVVAGVVGSPNEPVVRTEPPAGEFHTKGHEIVIYTAEPSE